MRKIYLCSQKIWSSSQFDNFFSWNNTSVILYTQGMGIYFVTTVIYQPGVDKTTTTWFYWEFWFSQMPSMIELLVKCIKGKECTKKENAMKEILEEITFLRNWLCKSNKRSVFSVSVKKSQSFLSLRGSKCIVRWLFVRNQEILHKWGLSEVSTYICK